MTGTGLSVVASSVGVVGDGLTDLDAAGQLAATLSRHLPADRVGLVDRAVARIIPGVRGPGARGLGFIVDREGTHRIPREHAQMILDAPPGVDLYPGTRIELA